MGFTDEQQELIIEVVEKWVHGRVGKDWVGDLHFRLGHDAKRYSEYASSDHPSMIFDGSIVYDFLNYGTDKWEFETEFSRFLTEVGLWYEMNHGWDCSFYALDDPETTMKKIEKFSVGVV